MSNIDGGAFSRFIPHRLFVNQLSSGFFELSVHFLLNSEDGEGIDQIEWEIVSEDRNCLLRSATSVPNQGTASHKMVQIAAVLPPSWDRGMLKVQFESNRTVSQFELPIDRLTQEVDFLLPLSGQALTVLGHRIGEAHRSALQIPSQQFGWDFLGLGEEDLSIVHLNESGRLSASDFPGFGMDVIAPADGRVYDARDGQSDIVEIGKLPHDLAYYQEDLTRALGNYVILEHDGGMGSVLAHLKENSLQVRVGQTVATGDILGALGNSGFTSGPHLHFHVMDGLDLLQASPLPVVLTLEDGVFAPQSGDIISNA